MFIAIRRGVYMQGIIGVFATLQGAISAVEEAVQYEPDDYHDFYVYLAAQGECVWIDYWNSGEMNGPKPVYELMRSPK